MQVAKRRAQKMEVSKTEFPFSKDPTVKLLASPDGETDLLDLDFRTQFHSNISWEMQLHLI